MLKLKQFRVLSCADAASLLMEDGMFSPADAQRLSTIGVKAEQRSCIDSHFSCNVLHAAKSQAESSHFSAANCSFSAPEFSVSDVVATTYYPDSNSAVPQDIFCDSAFEPKSDHVAVVSKFGSTNYVSSHRVLGGESALQAKRHVMQSVLDTVQALGVRGIDGYKAEHFQELLFQNPNLLFQNPISQEVSSKGSIFQKVSSFKQIDPLFKQTAPLEVTRSSIEQSNCENKAVFEQQGLHKHVWFIEDSGLERSHKLTEQANNTCSSRGTINLERETITPSPVLSVSSAHEDFYSHTVQAETSITSNSVNAANVINTSAVANITDFANAANSSNAANIEHKSYFNYAAYTATSKYKNDAASTASSICLDKGKTQDKGNSQNNLNCPDNVKFEVSANSTYCTGHIHHAAITDSGHKDYGYSAKHEAHVHSAKYEEQPRNAENANRQKYAEPAEWTRVISDFKFKPEYHSSSFTQAFNRATQEQPLLQESFQAHEVLAEQRNIHLMDRAKHQSYTSLPIEPETEVWLVNLESLPAFSETSPSVWTTSTNTQHGLSKCCNYAYLSHLEHSFAVLPDLDSTLEQASLQRYQRLQHKTRVAKQFKSTMNHLSQGNTSCLGLGNKSGRSQNNKESAGYVSNTSYANDANFTEKAQFVDIAELAESTEVTKVIKGNKSAVDAQHITSCKDDNPVNTEQHTTAKNSNLERHQNTVHKSKEAIKRATDSFDVAYGKSTDCKNTECKDTDYKTANFKVTNRTVNFEATNSVANFELTDSADGVDSTVSTASARSVVNCEITPSILEPALTQEALFSRTYQRVESLKQLLSKAAAYRQHRELNTLNVAQPKVELAEVMHIKQLEVQNDQGLLDNQSSMSVKADGGQNSFDAHVLSERYGTHQKTPQGEPLFSTEQRGSQNQVGENSLAQASAAFATFASKDTLSHNLAFSKTVNLVSPSCSACSEHDSDLAQSYSQAHEVIPKQSEVKSVEHKEGVLEGSKQKGFTALTVSQSKLSSHNSKGAKQSVVSPHNSLDSAEHVVKPDNLKADYAFNGAQSFIQFQGVIENRDLEFSMQSALLSLSDYQRVVLEDPILSQIFYIQHQYQVAFFLPKLHACINEFCREIKRSLLLASKTSFHSVGFFLSKVEHGLVQWGVKTWELMQHLKLLSTTVPECPLSHERQVECANIRRLLSVVIEYELQHVSANKAQIYRSFLNQK